MQQQNVSKYEISKRRFLRAVPQAAALLVPNTSWRDRLRAAANVVAEASSVKGDALFVLEWLLPENDDFTPYAGNDARAVERARDLETTAERLAKQFPGRKVRIANRETGRAVKRFRFSAATGAMGTY